jgi:valyl-tRNA synthetase
VTATVLGVLRRVLVLCHPILPFVTEEIWSFFPDAGERGLLAVERWSTPDPGRIDEAAEAEIDRVIGAVTALRRYRDAVEAPASARLPARLQADGYERTAAQVERLARFAFRADTDDDGARANGGGAAAPIASVPVPGGVVHVLPSEAIDVDEVERRRADRRRALEQEIARAEGRLATRGFVEKAPARVVEAEREKLARFQEELAALL